METKVGAAVQQALGPVMEAMQTEIFRRAEAIGEAYRAESWSRRKGPLLERPRFTLYVTRGRAGVAISYKKVHFMKTKKGWQPRSEHVAIGGTSKKRNVQYSMGKFRGAPAWERRMIERMEEQFAELRRASAYLARLAAFVRGIPKESPEQSDQAEAA